MGSKSLRTWSALAAFSVVIVGCTNGPQKDKNFGAYNQTPQNGKAQTVQGMPGSPLPAFPKADTNAAFNNQPKAGGPQLPSLNTNNLGGNQSLILQTGNPAKDRGPSGINPPPANPLFTQPMNPSVPPMPQPPIGLQGNPSPQLNPGFATDPRLPAPAIAPPPTFK
jgi:hypothetical protein